MTILVSLCWHADYSTQPLRRISQRRFTPFALTSGSMRSGSTFPARFLALSAPITDRLPFLHSTRIALLLRGISLSRRTRAHSCHLRFRHYTSCSPATRTSLATFPESLRPPYFSGIAHPPSTLIEAAPCSTTPTKMKSFLGMRPSTELPIGSWIAIVAFHPPKFNANSNSPNMHALHPLLGNPQVA